MTEGDEVGVPELAAGRRGRHDLHETLHDAMDEHGIDVWVSPAAPGPAPEGIDDTGDPVMNLPWTHSGLPTVTLPVDETGEGLPLGLQCSARFGADEELLGWSELLADDVGLLTE
ncbi:amidase family protein [Halospeciosus flavus]|uniref:amidase family protein n=1 Tax=Halospeciosus flavus TaxID=3032283 RepID=UPI0036213E30